MTPVKLTIHATGVGRCALTGKDTEGVTVTFDDGTIREGFLSWRSFRQLTEMKMQKPSADPPKPAAALVPTASMAPDKK